MSDFEDMVRDHAGFVSRVVSAYERNPAAAEDLVQDVWMAMMSAWPKYDRRAAPRTYIARVTHNVCVSHIRRQVRRRFNPLSTTLPSPDAGPDQLAQNQADREKLLRAVQSLPDPLRSVIVLYLEDLSVAEIAIALDLTPTNVGVRLTRARTLLRQRLANPPSNESGYGHV